jgi:hypothetical protein
MTQHQLDIWRKLTAESESNLEARIKFDKYMEEQGEVIVKETKLPTFGELLINTESEDADVVKVTELASEIAEILKKRYSEDQRGPVKSLLFDHAVGELFSAHAAVVKVLTMKPNN